MTDQEKKLFNERLAQRIAEQIEAEEIKKIKVVEQAKEQLLARMRAETKDQNRTGIGLIKLC